MNHSLCCQYDNSNASPLPTFFISSLLAFPPLISSSTLAAISPMLPASNITLTPTSTPIASLILDTTCVAINECPPCSKKLSFALIPSTPNTASHIPNTISSISLPLPLSSCSCSSLCSSILANAFRSTLPFAVNGISAITITLPGTIYSGTLFLSSLFTSLAITSSPSSSPTYPPSLLPPPASAFTTTTASFIPACCSNAASISPISIRYPLIFTCWSNLPRYSISPSALSLATSPVLYILLPYPPL